jgi:hypothetical protein
MEASRQGADTGSESEISKFYFAKYVPVISHSVLLQLLRIHTFSFAYWARISYGKHGNHPHFYVTDRQRLIRLTYVSYIKSENPKSIFYNK